VLSTSPISVPPTGVWEGHFRGSSDYRRILTALGFAGFATFAGLYAPQSLLPAIQRSFGITAAESAMTVSVSTIALALALLPWSWVADRIGRLSAMTIALVASAAIGLLIPFAPSFEALLVLRALLGLALGGLPALAITYLHDEVSHRFSAIAAAAYISGTTIGGALGRLVAGPVAAILDWRGGLIAVACACALSAVAFILIVPRAQGYSRETPPTIRDVLRGVATSLRNPTLLVLYGQGMLLMGSFVAVYNFFAFRLEAPEFGISAFLVSFIFAAYIAGTVSSRVAAQVVSRFGRSTVVVASGGLMLVGLALTLIPIIVVMVAGLVVFTFGFFAAHSVNSAGVGRTASGARAQATSLYNIAVYVGSGLFGWLAGIVWAVASWWGVFLFVAGLIVLALALLVLPKRAAERSLTSR